MFLGSQVRKLDITFDPGVWQYDDSEICSIGMIQPLNSRNSVLSGLSGLTTLSSCGSPEALDRLPELPWAEERRLRRAAQLLQQRLVLRQWLATHRLQHAYPRLVSLDVSSLEDVYWLEDSTARHALDPKDFGAWSAARQSLPTGKEQLQTLKTDLWSAVVKNSRHQDAWTWGGMLVVSASVAGLVTLAAMTQPSLAPEAKHSLLQYVTGKYLQPAACRVEWGWQEPQSVGETMCFTIHCYQRNGQPYPICDTDELTVTIAHGTRKVEAVIELGSGEPAQANTARVKFTVRTAGVYIISVLIGGMPISGSPYRRCFVAGRVAARASRAGAGGALAALPCVAGRARPVPLHPRDKYDNAAEPSAALATGFSVSIAPLGSPPDPELTKFATLSYDAVNQRVMLTLCLPNPGVFKATVTYENEPVMNGEFDCIVLTPSDAATVQRNISAKRPHAHYPATLLSRGAPPGASPSPSDASPPAAPARGRRIVCCLTPMTVTLKDYWLHLIPKRIAAFRLKPNTKLILQPSSGGDGGGGGGRLTLDDGVQPALELHSAQRDLIVATFAQLLRNNCGNEDSFKNKQEYFYASVRAHHARLAHDKVSIVVSRDALLRSSYLATRHLAHADWRKSFDVTFRSEQGVDWGGVRREWFSLLCAAIFEHSGLFAPFGDQPNGLVRPNPHRDPSLKLKYYELAGKIVGKCIYESALGGCYRQLVRARLARSFRAQLLGLPTSYTHFEQDDPELWLSKVKYVLETDLEAAAEELYFSDDVYDARGRLLETRDLAPRGRDTRVTNANKVQYLEALARWRLVTQSRAESAAFLRGLALLVPDHLLSAFDENELELLVCGTAELSVADWRAHALVSGGGGAGGAGRARVLGWLWAALDNFSAEERARLLQFTTGCSQLPPGGFQELNPRFQITAAPTFGALPTAHTCFNQLCLPDYDSYEHLVHALLWAINEGGEGFGMI